MVTWSPVTVLSAVQYYGTFSHTPSAQQQVVHCCQGLLSLIKKVIMVTTKTSKPSTKDSKAKAAKKAALQGANSHSARKVRTSVSFHRPKTLRLPREPRYPRKSIPHAPRMDQFRTIVSYVSLSFSLGALYTKVIIGH